MAAFVILRSITILIMTVITWMTGSSDGVPYCSRDCECQDEIYGDLRGFSTKCINKRLERPPWIDIRTTELYLRGNELVTVKNEYFKGLVNLRCLDLSYNMIQTIEIDAFKDLVNLDCLFLKGQRAIFFLPQRVFKPGVFRSLKNLKILTIHRNVYPSISSAAKVPSEALKDLTNLFMLKIDGWNRMVFNDSFKSLTKLTNIEMSGKTGTCELQKLDNNSFVGLVALKRLTMIKCHIETIEDGTFMWMNNLEYLDISSNMNLGFENLKNMTSNLAKLRYLNISSIQNPHKAGVELTPDYFTYFPDMQLVEIQMNYNAIELFDYNISNRFPTTLKRLYLRGNRLTFGHYINGFIFNNPNLTIFDAADQTLAPRADRAYSSSYDAVYHEGLYTNQTRHKRHSDNVELELQTMICSGSVSDISLVDFANTTNHITYMDLSRNFLPKLRARAFTGLSSLIYLNLSNNYIELVHKTAFNGLSNLEVLDLENNLMGISFQEDRSGTLFHSLGNLRELRLSLNRIYRIDKNLFTKLHNITVLDLSENFLETVDFTLASLENLHVLDLSNNRLKTLPGSLRLFLNRLAKHKIITVNIDHNSLMCTCDTIVFMEWLLLQSDIMFTDKENYYCTLTSGEILTLNGTWSEEHEQLKEDCVSYLEIIVASAATVSFMCAVFISFLVYYNRWRLRYMYYMAKVKMHHGHKKAEEENMYEFDAFLSYGDGDRVFATEDMRVNLENVSGKRLNIRDRDFELGEAIAINISRAIRTSKRTFLLVSRYFLNNKWCNFEMNMAIMEEIHQKRKVIVVVFLETIPPRNLPIELLDLLRKCPSTDLPKDPELLEVFWHKCVQYIHEI